VRYILPIFFFLTGCASTDFVTPYQSGYFRDQSFCQETIGNPSSSYSHKSGFFADKRDFYGQPICSDLRIGIITF
jgi:hypothetical protein